MNDHSTYVITNDGLFYTIICAKYVLQENTFTTICDSRRANKKKNYCLTLLTIYILKYFHLNNVEENEDTSEMV